MAFTLITLACACGAAFGQGRPDPKALMEEQRQAPAPLAFMDGVWRGAATTTLPSGEKHVITQTERIGPMLDGTIKVIEGRGYDVDGKGDIQCFCNPLLQPSQQVIHHALARHGERR